MKDKKILVLIITALIVALFANMIIIKSKSSSESKIVRDNEIVNAINNTEDEITEETENIVLENELEEQETEAEADITEQENISQKEEQKQTIVVTQEKEVESSKQIEQPKVTQTATTNQETTEQTKQETNTQEQPKEENKTEVKQSETPKCTDTKHGVGVGNSNKWFNSYSEAISYYDSLINDYSNQIHSGQITAEEYNKLCPYGYETWSCPYCGKWTLNYYMR